MIMMGLKLRGDVPFREVYIHALVRDAEGQKMSKSKGNVIDPLDVMERYGTDAFRFTLAALAAMGRDIKLSEQRITGYQAFVNKLWNATRFVLMNVGDGRGERGAPALRSVKKEDLNLADRWILSRLASTVREARDAIAGYRFSEMANQLYQFTWHEFCDWYIEMSKLSLSGTLGDDPRKTRRILTAVLDHVVRLLHPVMPFVTEEIWQALMSEGGERASGASAGSPSIMVQPYPQPEPGWMDPEAEEKVGFLTEVIHALRNLRAEMNCPPARTVDVALAGPEESLAVLRGLEPYLAALARVGSIDYLRRGERPRGAATAVVGGTEIYLLLGDWIDLQSEEARLLKEVDKAAADLERAQKKLSNPDFLAKAREEVVETERRKAADFEEKIQTLRRSLERIRQIRAGR
jgi:valyl-tRNA synthetase